MDSAASLENRVSTLEFEVRKLHQRLASLEGKPASPAASPAAPPPTAATRTVTPPPPVATPAPPPRQPVAPPPLPKTPKPPPAPPSALHEVLTTLGLVPPRAGTSGEAQLGAWWATRLGALLAVIGIVFFGIYLSAHTSPLVRWIELAFIVSGVTFAGSIFERRQLRIGPVVTGAGLALTYFTAFAAYAIPAVKVIDAVPVAALLQSAAVITIGARALQRDSRTIALMAIVLGFVSAYASLNAGLAGYAALAGLGLSIAAVGIHRHRGWTSPLFASAGLAPLLYLVLAHTGWHDLPAGFPQVLPFLFIGVSFAAHLAVLPRYLRDPQAPGTDRRMRVLQSLQTSLHVLAGLVVTHTLMGRPAIDQWFFASGGTLVLITFLVWRARATDDLVALLAVKASALIALGIIEHWDARTRWMALLVQAGVLLATAHRTRRPSLWLLALGAWAVSLGFFCTDLSALSGHLLSPAGGAVLVYLFASTLLLDAARQLGTKLEPDHQQEITGLLALGNAIPALGLVAIAVQESWFAVAAFGLLGGLELVRRWRGSLLPLPAMAIVLCGGHAALQLFTEGPQPLTWLWAGAIVLVPTTFLAARIIGRTTRYQAASIPLYLLAQAGLGAALLQSLPVHLAFALTLIAGAGLAAFARTQRNLTMATAAVLSFAGGTVLGIVHGIGATTGASEWKILSALVLPALWLLTPRACFGADEDHRGLTLAHWIAAIPGVAIILAPIIEQTPDALLSMVVIAVVVVLGGLARRLDLAPARFVTGSLAIIGAITCLFESSGSAAGVPWVALLGQAGLGLLLATLPHGWQPRSRPVSWFWSMLYLLVGALSLTLITLRHGTPWFAYGSGLWAVGGLAFFALGLLLRSRRHRLMGLVILALCIVRVFVHDINDVQHRIIAFIVLGGLLIWVGFSYQRFRHLIETDDALTEPDEPHSPTEP